MINNYRITSDGEIKIPIAGLNDANFLYIFNGIVVFNFKGNGAEWLRDKLKIVIPHKFRTDTKFIKITASGALNSIANEGPAMNAGWALDDINAKNIPICNPANMNECNQYIEVDFDLAVRDSDGFIDRVSYQVFALVKE